MQIEYGPRFLKGLKRLSEPERELAGEAVRSLAGAWGRPHAHSGLGLRKLSASGYEVRVGLRWRIVFFDRADHLELYDVMNHDEVRRWLKNL